MKRTERPRLFLFYCVVPLAAATLAGASCSTEDSGGASSGSELATPAGTAAPSDPPDAADPVQAFAALAAEMPSDEAISPPMIAEALRGLAGAAGAADVVPLDVTVNLRVSAEHVVLNPESLDVAKRVSEALRTVADALADDSGGREAERVRTATAAIGASEPLTNQAAALREYFQATAAALAGARP